METTFLNKFGSSPPFELKFLRRSSRTIHAPNSCQIDDAAGGWVALNVWWECAEEDLFELKREMEGLSGSRVHYGKVRWRVYWMSTYIADKIFNVTNSLPLRLALLAVVSWTRGSD